MYKHYTIGHLTQRVSLRVDDNLHHALVYLQKRYHVNSSDLLRSMIWDKYEHDRASDTIPIKVSHKEK